MTMRPSLLLSMLILMVSAVSAQPSSLHIRVDQFGYRPGASKVCVLREPVQGYDAPTPWSPGSTIEIRRTANGSVAWSGVPLPWNSGSVHSQSGDRAWWVDFSALTETGSFFVYDPATGASSETFDIAPDVWSDVLRHATRMYYYQRCGTAKAAPHAESGWTDGPCHLAGEQDLDCRSVLNPAPSTSRNLSGGWHDAGDYNKYVNYADDALHPLLSAYETAPAFFGDQNGIPESGNGVPDHLDEVRWELEWLLRMQNGDGSVLHKMGVTAWQAQSPPSTDSAVRRYAPPTASATISACGAFAHAAHVFATLPDSASQAFATTLTSAAVSAWAWLDQNPGAIPSSYNNQGFASASAEDDAYWQTANHIRAAIWLYAATGDPVYRAFVDNGYLSFHLFQWSWASPWEQDLNESLLVYASLPGATPAVSDQIRTTWLSAAQAHIATASSGVDAYRAPLGTGDWTWGSNRTRVLQGTALAMPGLYGLDNAQSARDGLFAAEEYLHAIHGVNPTGHCFLTNMGSAGAEGSLNETYHAWFAHGTVWDNAQTSPFGPAPGILTGGPNPFFSPDPSYSGPPLVPPQGQPVQKSYRDWNTSWPENSWEVTECHIPYQAAYLRLLAIFAAGPAPRLGLAVSAPTPGQVATIEVRGADPGAWLAVVWGPGRGRFTASGPLWCLDLGLTLTLDPMLHVLCLAPADPQGGLTHLLPIPASLSGATVDLQATQAGVCPGPWQSAAITISVR